MKSKTEYRVLITFADGRKRPYDKTSLDKANIAAEYLRDGVAGDNAKWSPARYWIGAVVEVQTRIVPPWDTIKGESE